MKQSSVVLMARVDDPVEQVTRATYSTTVLVHHDPDEQPGSVVDMAIEIAPPMAEWSRY